MLHINYRPKNLSEIIGNADAVQALKLLIKRQDKPHSYLFTGASGCGKTTLARILANEFGVQGMDFREIDAADFRGIDTIRELRQGMSLSAFQGKNKGYLLDECHALTKDGQNALLKALEDTPPHVYFFLATTEPEKLIPTIRNRCVVFQVSPLAIDELRELVSRVSEKEGFEVDKGVRREIISKAEGCPRKALVLLSKTQGMEPEDAINLIKNEDGLDSESEGAIQLCRALVSKANWKTVSGIIKSIEDDPEKVRRAVLGYFTALLLNKDDMAAYYVLDAFNESFYNSGKAGLVRACYAVIKGGK